MRKSTFISVSVLLTAGLFASAQDTTKTKTEPPFVPSGKVGVTVLTNGSTTIQGEDVSGVGFTMERAYLGYTFNATKELSGEIKFDVGANEELLDSVGKINNSASINKRFMYLKNAYGVYTVKNSAIYFGIIPVFGYNLQETAWGNRYAYKTFMDVNKYSKSADIGVAIKQIIDETLSVDFSITNGEGFNTTQSNQDFVYSLGSTFKPNKQLTIRLFGDYSYLKYEPVTLSGFLGYVPTDNVSFGVEYDHKLNHDGVENQDLSGYSIYTTYSVTSKVKVFARYDDITSNILEGKTTPWNDKSNGTAVIGGLEIAPTKGLRIAASYNGFIFENTSKDTKHVLGIFAEIKI